MNHSLWPLGLISLNWICLRQADNTIPRCLQSHSPCLCQNHRRSSSEAPDFWWDLLIAGWYLFYICTLANRNPNIKRLSWVINKWAPPWGGESMLIKEGFCHCRRWCLTVGKWAAMDPATGTCFVISFRMKTIFFKLGWGAFLKSWIPPLVPTPLIFKLYL